MIRTKTILSFLVVIGYLNAAIDGIVMNRTVNKPQAGVTVKAQKPGNGGMRTMATTVSDASGHYLFKDLSGLQLLQAYFDGVAYNRAVMASITNSHFELNVYETTKSAAVARIARQMLFIEPKSNQTNVSEAITLTNSSNKTFTDPESGELQFYLPQTAKLGIRVVALAPQSLPHTLPAKSTKEAGVFEVNFPIKPGRTDFEIHYVLPARSPFTFNGRLVSVKGMSFEPLRLVAPSGVTFSGKDVKKVGTEPKTQTTLYNLTVTGSFSFDVTGTGTLQQAATLQPPRSALK